MSVQGPPADGAAGQQHRDAVRGQHHQGQRDEYPQATRDRTFVPEGAFATQVASVSARNRAGTGTV